MHKLLSSTLVSVCIAASATGAAFAQATPNADSRPGPRMEKRHAERPFSRPTERVEARLAYTKTALKISDAQQPQWEAYANFVRKNAQQREQKFKAWQSAERGRARGQRPNVIERLEKVQSRQAEAVTKINQYLVVLKPLYAALSPEQQKLADEVLNPRSARRHGREMGGRREFGRS